jgi:hypothetical protein
VHSRTGAVASGREPLYGAGFCTLAVGGAVEWTRTCVMAVSVQSPAGGCASGRKPWLREPGRAREGWEAAAGTRLRPAGRRPPPALGRPHRGRLRPPPQAPRSARRRRGRHREPAPAGPDRCCRRQRARRSRGAAPAAGLPPQTIIAPPCPGGTSLGVAGGRPGHRRRPAGRPIPGGPCRRRRSAGGRAGARTVRPVA